MRCRPVTLPFSRIKTVQQPVIHGRLSSTMSRFALPGGSEMCYVNTEGVDVSQEQLLAFPPFKTWSNTVLRSLSLQNNPEHEFHKKPYRLREITIQSVDWFGSGANKRLGFVKFTTNVRNDNGETLPGVVFMRGGSIAMLLILQPDDVPENAEQEKYVLLTVQARVAAGSLAFVEIPAGMLDDSGSFSGGAAKEIQEETGLEVKAEDLLDMTALAISSSSAPDSALSDEGLQKAVYPSPGGSDEFIPIFLYQKRIPRSDLEKFQGRLTGLRDEGEKITLKLVRLVDLWKEGARDGKTLAAWALYEGLKREGKI